ncbi:MAG TPA: alginate lyase family protein [Acidobacteriaceae bacterium]|jgi:poly(beta-D-mannuronate) lyase|nr:alginate lyase family protein [Acidobacteriaceae bacterium]
MRVSDRAIFAAAATLCALLFVSSNLRAASALRSPWDGHPVTATAAPYDCPAVVHLSPDLTTDGFYSDSKSSVIDPAKWKAYSESSGPYKNLGQVIVDAADAWRSTGSRDAAACALRHMEAAARDRVFTGKMSSHQAYYVQGWVIGAIAIVWLKVRDSGLETPALHDLVVPWLVAVTRQTTGFYDQSRARNNHLDWAGVEAAAAGVAANDQKLFDWAVAAYRGGVEEIQPDGSMPLEMARGQRALHYHLYALSPLVYIAEFGEVNGLHLYAERDHALAKLERLSVDGMNNNQFFQKATGIAQDTPNGAPAAEQISWGVIWEARFPDPALASLLSQASSLSYMYLGGLPPGANSAVAGKKE